MKATKLQFGLNEIECLGHVISEKGVPTSDDRVKGNLELPERECIKDNCGFLGTLNHVRRYIDGYLYGEITAPLVELTGNEYKKTASMRAFGPAQRDGFARAKRALTPVLVLKFPDFTREFIFHTDASKAVVEEFIAQRSRESSSNSDLDIIIVNY